MNWLRRSSRQKPYEPPYYLIDPRPRPRRFSTASVAKAAGAVLTLIALVTGTSAIYEHSKKTALNLTLEQTVSGYFLRVVNSGNTTALAVRIESDSWPIGAPGSWPKSYPPRDIPPGSDAVVPMELVPSFLSPSDRSEMLEGLEHSILSGYVMVTCNNCARSGNWAFSFPGYKSKGGAISASSIPPLVPIPKREDRPHIGYCVGVPNGVCGEFSSVWLPKQRM
jgi:hypothetical protein